MIVFPFRQLAYPPEIVTSGLGGINLHDAAVHQQKQIDVIQQPNSLFWNCSQVWMKASLIR